MNLLRTAMQIGVRQVLSLHLMALGTTAGLATLTLFTLDGRTRLFLFIAGGLLLVFEFLLLIRALNQLTNWERRLVALDCPTEAGSLSLVRSSRSTSADRGWNRLVEASQRWNALQELEHSLAQLLQQQPGSADHLLDSLPDAIVVVDSHGTIEYSNAMMASMCGAASQQSLLGGSIVNAFGGTETLEKLLLGQSQQPHMVVEWERLPTEVDGGSEERPSRTLRGTRRIMPANSVSERHSYVWTIRDVTQQRLADEMRDQFLAAATHEFRTPLANIRAYAESLDMGHDIDAESRKRFYNVIQSESVRLSQLVDDLLDISRMQAGALVLEERETDLERLVSEAAAKVQGQMGERKLQFRCELPPKFPKARVDKSKLVAALVNLLGNAAKYTPDGGRVTFRVDVNPSQVQFCVSDTGIGIAPEELPKIFDRFFRSNDDRVRDISGSGLGLALVQEVARLHGGELAVESELNHGSTFRLSIPLHSAA